MKARLASIGAVALAVRLAADAATAGYRPRHDDASYARVARWLLNAGHYPGHHLPGGGWQVSAYRPPGWPVALAAAWRVFGSEVWDARVLAALLGAAAAVLVAVLSGLLLGPRAAWGAGALAALSPLAVMVDASLESESLFTALVLASAVLALTARRTGALRWAVGAGALAGLAALTRTTGLVAVPAVALLAAPGAVALPRRALRVGVAVVVAALIVAPWTVRNAVELHTFVPVSTETGNTLAGTYNDASMHRGERWLEPAGTGYYRPIYARYGASARTDGALRRAVMAWVERHPAYPAVVLATDGARLLGLTGPAWAAFSLRTMSLGGGAGTLVWLGVLAVTLLVLAGAWLARGRGVPAAFWLLLGALFVPAALVNGELRLAAPAQAMALPLAGLAVARLRPTTRWG